MVSSDSWVTINSSKLCANFPEFLEVKDSLANSNGRLERRMEVEDGHFVSGKSMEIQWGRLYG